MSFGRVNSAFDIIAAAVKMHHRNPALLVLVVEFVWNAWVKRSLRVFQGNDKKVPLQIVFQNCVVKLKALESATELKAKLAGLSENCLFLLRCANFMSNVYTIM
jgi:hypothetical protein